MNITVGHWIVAEVTPQPVILQTLVGAFDLQFPLRVRQSKLTSPRCIATIFTARASVDVSAHGPKELGCAIPKIPLRIEVGVGLASDSPVLHLQLTPHQLFCIEDLRNGGDLNFSLAVSGIGTDGEYPHQIFDTWRLFVPQSHWVQQLRAARALDILLVEVPMPVVDAAEEIASVRDHLRSAQQQFVLGHYNGCIATCRLALDDLGNRVHGKNWAGPALSRLCAGRDDMAKQEREKAITAVVRHYTHPAHHSGSDGGDASYDRAEAKLLLTMTAAIAARAWSR